MRVNCLVGIKRQNGTALLAAAVLFTAWPASARNISSRKVVWENTDCARESTCDLKKVVFKTWDYRVVISGEPSFGTGLSAHYRTASLADLPKYGFVQTTRGCVFDSVLENGAVEYYHQYVRDFFGKRIVHHHPRWVYDTVDPDPFYNSLEGKPRHYLYQWNRVRGSTRKTTREFYGLTSPTDPELYILDYPGTAFSVFKNEAKNLSMEFEICLYRTSDVPMTIAPDAVPLAKALTCFKWSSSFIYDHTAQRYTIGGPIHPVCLKDIPQRTVLDHMAQSYKPSDGDDESRMDFKKARRRIERFLDHPEPLYW